MSSSQKKILISACLCGDPTRYDGKSKPVDNPAFKKWIDEKVLIKVCPEVLGGLSVPRSPAEIKNGRVINSDGNDVTQNFTEGARLALELAVENRVMFAILKESSPSCGSSNIYDGSFRGNKIPGEGIFVRMLRQNNIKVFSENDIDKAFEFYINETNAQ